MSEYIDNFIKSHREYFKRNHKVIESNFWNDTKRHENGLKSFTEQVSSIQTTDPKQKESMFDSFEKTDETISKLKNTLGRGKVRSALGMGADTGFGRGIQNLRAKAGAAITGNQPVR